MPQFVVNSQRLDPYKNFKFRVMWDGRYVAGISKVSALKRATEPVTHREGGSVSSAHLSPSTWKFDPVTLERGVTHDTDFEAWANLANNMTGDPGMSLKNFRKDGVKIEVLNEQGSVALVYNLYRCWVSEYTALPELDANAHVVAIEKIVLQNEGWERDTSVSEPMET
jgi:phage tail-like protein